MSSIKSILSPVIDEGSPTRSTSMRTSGNEIEREEPPAKRPRSTPPTQSQADVHKALSLTSTSIAVSKATSKVRDEIELDGKGKAEALQVKDERKTKWLAGLSHEELLGVAQGAVWQVGGLHNTICFHCKKPGTLLECHNCPRSYHRRCLDPPIHGNYKIDGPWFCPNCSLLTGDGGGGGVGMVNGLVWNRNARIGDGRMKVEGDVEVDGVTPLHRERELVSRTAVKARQISPASVISGTSTMMYDGEVSKGLSAKRSRYSTLSADIDDALGLLGRELEQAGQMKVVVAEMEKKLVALEQEVRIWRGRAELLERDRVIGIGLGVSGKGGEEDGGRLRSENRRLREEIESLKREGVRRAREWDEWRKSMRAFVDGK